MDGWVDVRMALGWPLENPFNPGPRRLCKINPKDECHRQVFSELSQKAQRTEPKHCSALLLHNTTEFLQKTVMEMMEMMEMMEIMDIMEMMEIMEMLELMEMMERMEKMI